MVGIRVSIHGSYQIPVKPPFDIIMHPTLMTFNLLSNPITTLVDSLHVDSLHVESLNVESLNVDSLNVDSFHLHSSPAESPPLDDGILSFFGVALRDWITDNTRYSTISKIASFTMDAITTTPDSDTGHVDIESVVGVDINNIRTILRTIGTINETFGMSVRMQSVPLIEMKHIGSWRIPIWNYILVSPLSNANITLIDKHITYTKKGYVINLSLNIPSPIEVSKQHFSLLFAVYYGNVRIVTVFLPNIPHITPTSENTLMLTITTCSLDHFMQFIGDYSEGRVLRVTVKDVEVVYEDDERRIMWIDELVKEMVMDVDIPAYHDEIVDGIMGGIVFGLRDWMNEI